MLDFYATTHLDIFAKAGPAFNFQRFKYTNSNGETAKAHKDAAALKFAVGLGYDISENVNLNLTREFQTKQKHDVLERSTIPANATLIGLRYKFC